MIFEFLINLITPYPFLIGKSYKIHNTEVSYVIRQELNEFLLAFSMMVRIYLIIRFYMTCFSDFT